MYYYLDRQIGGEWVSTVSFQAENEEAALDLVSKFVKLFGFDRYSLTDENGVDVKLPEYELLAELACPFQ